MLAFYVIDECWPKEIGKYDFLNNELHIILNLEIGEHLSFV